MIQQPPAYSANQPQGTVFQQVTVQPPQTTVMATQQPPPGNWQGMKVTGIAQIVIGSLIVILGIVTLAIETFFAPIASPIWCGLLFFIVAGILGTLAGQRSNSCAAVAYLVMSIFACLASCVVIGFSGGAITSDLFCAGYYQSSYNYYYCNPGGRVAVDAMLVILGIVEFVMSIVGASMTCSALCYSAPSHTVIQYQAQPQVVIAGQPQGVLYHHAGQPQYGYPQQQAMGAPQGQFQPPPQTYQPQPNAPPPPGAVDDHQYQPLTK